MSTEYKYVELSALKMTDAGPGTIEGLRAVFDIDEGGDLLIKGAFRDTMEEYLNSGFSAHSHVWTFSEAVGFPVEARETDRGWWVKSQFHSTDTAQNVRTIAKERMKAGKTVGFSFGYSARDYDFIDARNYERELPRYVDASRLAYNMAQAKKFPKVRILRAVDVIEDSIVTAPMNKLAMATGVKYVRGGHGGHYHVGDPATEVLRLRSKSLRLRASVLQTLHGGHDDDPRARSEALRLRVESTLRMASLRKYL